jgi:aminopeptidase N
LPKAIADANPGSAWRRLLPQFKRWYSQAGTPHVHAHGTYDAAAQTYTLEFKQSCAATANQSSKALCHPCVDRIGGKQWRSTATCGCKAAPTGRRQPSVRDDEEPARITFTAVTEEPVPSILRGFSARCCWTLTTPTPSY